MAKKGIKFLIFSLIPTIGIFLILEGFLRAVGFMYSRTPLEMRLLESQRTGALHNVLAFGEYKGTRLVKDAKQLWIPDEPFARGYTVKKPHDVTRIVALGDSCTWFCVGSPKAYPELMEEVLREKHSTKVEVLNAGVGSHSSYQGLQRLKYTVLPYQPDIITVFYGWNDHWVTFREDKEVEIRSDLVTSFLNFAERFRTFQFLNYLMTKLQPKSYPQELKFRVMPQDYKDNLNRIIDIAQEHNIKVILMTAPHDLSNFAPAEFFPYPKERLIPLHQYYNQIVRRVAQERGVPLVDLEMITAVFPQGMILSRDGIHFGQTGCQMVAEILSQKIITESLI